MVVMMIIIISVLCFNCNDESLETGYNVIINGYSKMFKLNEAVYMFNKLKKDLEIRNKNRMDMRKSKEVDKENNTSSSTNKSKAMENLLIKIRTQSSTITNINNTNNNSNNYDSNNSSNDSTNNNTTNNPDSGITSNDSSPNKPLKSSPTIDLTKSNSNNSNPINKVYSNFCKFHNSSRKINKSFPSTVTYASVLNSCARTKNMTQAESFLQEMISNKVSRNPYIYSTLINGYRKIKAFQPALKLYLQIRENSFDAEMDEDYKLSQVIFNSILDCCVECGEFSYMQEIFYYLSDLSGVRLDSDVSVSSVLTAKTRIKTRIVPDLITYSIVIKGYARANNLNKVMEIYKYLSLNNYELDEVLFNTLLDGFAKHNNNDAFEKIIYQMEVLGIEKSVITYGVIMKLYSKQNDVFKAKKLFYEMVVDLHITPTVIIYQLLIKTIF